ncbi:hypothetical protein C8R45DRAFT_928797 [Mycena sanguinolenta]|nr:hypothetical protein C8R45DRAFT_928797 [Mycena sanguinolenta]
MARAETPLVLTGILGPSAVCFRFLTCIVIGEHWYKSEGRGWTKPCWPRAELKNQFLALEPIRSSVRNSFIEIVSRYPWLRFVKIFSSAEEVWRGKKCSLSIQNQKKRFRAGSTILVVEFAVLCVTLRDSDLSEAVGDVPAFESENSLLAWLDVGKERLKKILESIRQPKDKEKGRGPYYKTKIGAAPAPRTDRLKRATQNKTIKAHGHGLMSWLSKNRDSLAASTSTSDTRETLQADDLDDQPIDVDALTPTPSQADEPEVIEHEEAVWISFPE